MGVRVTTRGDFNKAKRFLKSMKEERYLDVLDACGQKGVQALSENTPEDSGVTAASWSYKIDRGRGHTTIEWYNDNVVDGWFNVAISLQYGHGTGTGGYVKGRDYINPAMQPIFDDIAETVWKVVQAS